MSVAMTSRPFARNSAAQLAPITPVPMMATRRMGLSAGSLAFTRAIDEAAAAMFALQHEVLAAQGIPVQGIGREPYRS